MIVSRTGPLAGMMVNRFNTRIVALISGCSLLTGFIATIYATNLLMLYITYGLCLGWLRIYIYAYIHVYIYTCIYILHTNSGYKWSSQQCIDLYM